MITLPLKESERASWSEHLVPAIAQVYGSAGDFKREIDALDSMRDVAIGVSANATGRDLLYKYYAQLELLALHVPLRPFKLSFTWHDLYDGDSVTQPALAFEKACVLYNLGAVLSHLGAEAAAAKDFKRAYHCFSCAAGVFALISENFLHLACADLRADTLSALKAVMLAQAQHCFFLKAQESGAAPKLVAKLGAAALAQYAAAREALAALISSTWGQKSDLKVLDQAVRELSAEARLAEAAHLEAEHQYGAAIAHLKEARQFLDRREAQDLLVRIKQLERDNDLIYHERVPSAPPPIAETLVAKPVPLSSLYSPQEVQRVVDQDLFERMVPVAVHERASVYSELKAQFLRDEQEKSEVADLELTSALEYMDLPAAAARLKQSAARKRAEVPPEVLEWSFAVRTHPLSSVPVSFDAERARILALLQPPATSASNAVKQGLLNGRRADSELQALYARAQSDIRALESPQALPESYARHEEPNILDLDIGDGDGGGLDAELEKVSQLVVRLKKIMAERQASLKDLRAALQGDDATQLLIAHQDTPNVVEDVLKPELQKFAPYVKRVDATIRLQTAALSDVADLWQRILDSDAARKRMADEEAVQRHQDAVTDGFRRAYDAYLQICDASEKAQRFYDDLERQARQAGRPGAPPAARPSAPPVPAKPKLSGLSGYTTPSTYDPSMYR